MSERTERHDGLIPGPRRHHAQVAGLTVRYGGTAAVNDVSIDIPGGAVTALVGSNGAGKSSLLLALYGSVPSEGVFRVDGEDLEGMSALRRVRSGIAIVPQGRQLFPRLTVRENLQVMAELLRVRGAVDDAVDRFPILRERLNSLAGVLSGGEQQMLVVTRALMAQPRVLLLDEMMTGLAPLVVKRLAATVRELAASGVAVLLAEPSIGALRRMIDRGYVLVRSRIVASVEGGGYALDESYQRVIGVQRAQAERAIAAAD